jgi:hypothetical protein
MANLSLFGQAAGGFIVFGVLMAIFNFAMEKINGANYKKQSLGGNEL